MTYWKEKPIKPNITIPEGIKHNKSILNYPIDFSAWLTQLGGTYVSHTITTTGSIKIDSSTHSSGVITVIISGGSVNEQASFTINIVCLVSGTTIKESKKFLLDIV